ncbi:MAG: hypothetical protein GKR89_25270 [Candidatus Latescibacteria bacterium]|nr:hypothetical protein [Candidatus Latescibacterota bacterium]
MLEHQDYKVADPDAFETPAMLVFDHLVDHNIQSLCAMADGAHNLMVHVKTHKSADITARQLQAGIAGFKCAILKELEMVLEAGAPHAILAYPMVQARKVERFADLSKTYDQARAYAVVSAPLHFDLLDQVATQRQQTLRVMLDLDVGMHRTGVATGDSALALYRAIDQHPFLEAAGIHAYDGHDHRPDAEGRQQAAQVHIDEIHTLKGQLEEAGLPVPLLVAGGSYSFLYYARTQGMYGSPGTSIYWDLNGVRGMPDMPFRYAALVLTQVVDRHPQQQTFTTDLGHKAIAGDPPQEYRASLLGREDAELIVQNEEHGVFRTSDPLPEIGDYILAAPGHVCATIVRHPGSYIVDAAGDLIDYYPHTARDRS